MLEKLKGIGKLYLSLILIVAIIFISIIVIGLVQPSTSQQDLTQAAQQTQLAKMLDGEVSNQDIQEESKNKIDSTSNSSNLSDKKDEIELINAFCYAQNKGDYVLLIPNGTFLDIYDVCGLSVENIYNKAADKSIKINKSIMSGILSCMFFDEATLMYMSESGIIRDFVYASSIAMTPDFANMKFESLEYYTSNDHIIINTSEGPIEWNIQNDNIEFNEKKYDKEIIEDNFEICWTMVNAVYSGSTGTNSVGLNKSEVNVDDSNTYAKDILSTISEDGFDVNLVVDILDREYPNIKVKDVRNMSTDEYVKVEITLEDSNTLIYQCDKANSEVPPAFWDMNQGRDLLGGE